MTPPRAGRAGLVALLLLVLTGCINVPTGGSLEKVEGLEPACQSCVNVDVAPPAPGASKLEIAQGYLLANANYQPGYSVAKQFLTRSAVERWSPDASVTIYTGAPAPQDDAVVIDGALVGSLDEDLGYTRRSGEFRQTFEFAREDGEWRISSPIPGLLIQKQSFSSRYTAYDLYYVGSGGALVPDPIYLPPLRNPATFASALVKELLDGPSERLSPAVTPTVPEGTSLSTDSVTIANGLAQVRLSGPGLQHMDDAARSLFAAQLVYTLRQLSTIQEVLLLVDSAPFRVPQSDDSQGLAIPVRDISPELDPVPQTAVEPPLHAVQDGAVVRVGGTTDKPQVEKVDGPLGTGRPRVDSLAVSGTGSELAAVTGGRTELRYTSSEGAEPVTLLRGATKLLRPQITRTGEVWALGRVDGRQRLWVADGGRPQTVAAPVLDDGEVKAFRVSPDGSRVALLVREGSTTRLGVGLLQRTEGGRVGLVDWRALDVDSSPDAAESPGTEITQMRDVTWADPTTMLVLTRSKDTPYVLTQVSLDASSIQSETPFEDLDPVQVSVLLRTETAVLLTRTGQAFRDEGQEWRRVATDLTAIAYPG